MKKIILFLILAYSYSFSLTYIDTTFGSTTSAPMSVSGSCSSGSFWSYSHTDGQNNVYKQHSVSYARVEGNTCFVKTRSSIYRVDLGDNPDIPHDGFCPKTHILTQYGLAQCNSDTGELKIIPNPEPNSSSPTCSEGFVKDGQYYNCNPNTNEAQLVPNSDGYEEDEDGKTYPKCGSGFEGSSTLNIVSGSTSYTSQSCVQVAEPTPPTEATPPTVTTNPDGSKTWNSPDGNTYHLTPNGTLTTNYPDGSSSVFQVGSNYPAGSTGGVSGSTGGGSGGGTAGTGTDGNTNNELSPTPTPQTPIDNTPVANSCNDSNLTLQEKLLCEMNAGVKKLNSESTPENSLNNLAKEINNDLNTNFTAVNKNIKDTNTLLTSSKALQENQLKELKDINTNLKNLKISGGTNPDTTTGTTETPLPTDTEGISDAYGADSKNFIDGLLGQYTTFKNNIDTQIDTLNNTFNNAKTTFENGVELNLTSTEIVNCPISYTLDMSSFFNKQIPISIDFCEHTSKLKPLLYPVFLILMSLGVVFLAIRFIGVLI